MVEQAEQHGEQNKETEICHCVVILLPLAIELPQLHLEKYLVYSIRAANTNTMQAISNASMEVSPSTWKI
jgi:hypothetical protein